MSEYDTSMNTDSHEAEWYDLFSRGARDWLRHNDKVREAVREQLPELISEADILSGESNRTVHVPVRMLEHFRFRLRQAESTDGVGQGKAESGDVLRRAQPQGQGKGAGGEGEGGLEFVVELKVDDIVDWLWEELELPNLDPKAGAMEEEELIREGWDRQGPRARLDRRRTLKEAVKRRSIQPSGPSFSNDDLRFRQLVKRPRPSTHAVIFFGLDVSASMSERDRTVAKTFFFWALQGLRRQYQRIDTVFIAHTVQAWEFTEQEFFQVTAHGGTVASTAFRKVQEIIGERYDPARHNIYLFYASDGENFPEDRDTALASLRNLGEQSSFMGFLETGQSGQALLETETARMFRYLESHKLPVASYGLSDADDVWQAIRAFFQHQAEEAA